MIRTPKRGAGSEGLDQRVINDWFARWGVNNPSDLTPPTRFVGRAGLATYSAAFSSVTAERPEAYESLTYHRELSMMMAHCELHTPRRTELTAAKIRSHPMELVIVASHVLEGSLRIAQYGRKMTYTEGQLVVLALDSPFVNVVDSVADSAMLLIPKRLLGLGTDIGRTPELPIAADSLVSRSTAQFVRRFACDAAVLGRDVTPDMELSAIRTIREAIGLHSYDERRPHRESPGVREAAIELIEQHYRDPMFSADAIASMLHISRRHLYRHFAQAQNSPVQLLKRRRLAQAMELLACTTELSLDDIASQSGFISASTLRARMRAETGLSPIEFRASRQADRRDELKGSK